MTWTAWDGSFNLFDLGGVATERGVTGSGRAFRSGRPEALTEQDWRDARRDGLTTIIDLRNEPERGRKDHDPFVDDAALSGITVIHAPTENPDDTQFMRVCGPWLDHPRSYADNVRFYPEKFRVVFEGIAHSDGAVLIHCAGGRDRTGMIVAMLLSLAGASPEAIAQDYERAFRNATALVALHPERSNERVWTEPEIDARVAERRCALIEWISEFDVVAYLVDAGLSAEDIRRMRDKLH